MKIACVILGTRGDVQPMIALALGLMEHGHDVMVCAPPEHAELAGSHHCPFVPFGPDVKEKVKEEPEKQKGGVAVKISLKDGKKLIGDQITLLPGILKDVDLLLAAGIVLGVHTAADQLKVPYRLVAYYPIILGASSEDPFISRMKFSFGRSMMNLMLKGFINTKRKRSGLSPIKDIWEDWMGEHVILACDKELHGTRTGTIFPFIQTGFMMLPSGIPLPDEVEEFLQKGSPPVYIGFGSNPITRTEKYSPLFEQVRDLTNQRLIISRGWAGLPAQSSRDILYVDEMPFELLFPRMAAAIYHGGTGTMSAIARAGIPQAAFPFMGDQFDNRKQIVKRGLGPETCDFKKISAEAISAAVNACVTNETYRNNALEISRKLLGINGIDLTVQYIEREFVKSD